jgi:hypothetical protein
MTVSSVIKQTTNNELRRNADGVTSVELEKPERSECWTQVASGCKRQIAEVEQQRRVQTEGRDDMEPWIGVVLLTQVSDSKDDSEKSMDNVEVPRDHV